MIQGYEKTERGFVSVMCADDFRVEVTVGTLSDGVAEQDRRQSRVHLRLDDESRAQRFYRLFGGVSTARN